MGLRLVLGNKNYPSWSMRAWLLLRFVNAPFDEISISLYVPGSREKVMKLGGQTGLVPVLEADGFPIWDTLAIAEYLFEGYPSVWPDERFARARARSYSGEVHSSLNALRNAMPVNTRGRRRSAVRTDAVEQDIARVADIWASSGTHRDGPWLFGAFCAADIMFAPVASRFQTYGVSLTGQAERYLNQLLSQSMSKLRFFGDGYMLKKRPNLAMLADRIAEARRIIETQQAQLMKLQASGQSTYEADGALRIYVSSLLHLLAHAEKLQVEAKALKGETKRVNH